MPNGGILIRVAGMRLKHDLKIVHRSFSRQNCQRALILAEKYLGIPTIISAEHLSSRDLDELSCITYLSYFVKKGGPGYQATMENVQKV